MNARIYVLYKNGKEIVKKIENPSTNIIIDKKYLEGSNIELESIKCIDVKFDGSLYLVEIDDGDMNIENYGISNFINSNSSIKFLKLHNIKSIDTRGLDINHLETEKTSILMFQCNINELYTETHLNRYYESDDFEPPDSMQYRIDIRKDSRISHFYGIGHIDLNVQESYIKEMRILAPDFLKENTTKLDNIHIWNGSTIHSLKLTAPTLSLKVEDSSINTLILGKSHIEKIELIREIIGKCSLDDESIDSDEIGKWELIKKASLQEGDRIKYINAAYTINKKLSQLEKPVKRIWFSIFDLLCGFGYKPTRTIITSLVLVVLFGLLYFLIDIIVKSNTLHNASSIIDYLYYSGITFTTIGYGDIFPNHWLIKILSILEAGSGVSMLSLFIFSLTKTLTEYIHNK